MNALAFSLALLAAVGVFFVYTAVAFGWTGAGVGPRLTPESSATPKRAEDWLVQAGLVGVDVREFVLVVAALFAVGALVGFAVFGGVAAPIAFGGFVASFPIASYLRQEKARKAKAREAWPRMLEELRVMTGSAGRSIPQALFEVGARGPDELRPAFDAAHREWLISTDFARTMTVLKARLADATADAVAETLLIAHELGGGEIEARLVSLIEDRVQDLQGRKDARSRQAGARYARWFVLAVPFGMALAGMSIGNGRAAYSSGGGQALVVVAIAMVVGCWTWASVIMKLPEEDRVFPE